MVLILTADMSTAKEISGMELYSYYSTSDLTDNAPSVCGHTADLIINSGNGGSCPALLTNNTSDNRIIHDLSVMTQIHCHDSNI